MKLKKEQSTIDNERHKSVSSNSTALQGASEAAVGDSCRFGEEAFKKAYIYSIGPLVKFLNVLLHSIDDAEDVAQSVFSHIWEHRDKIDASQNFNGYLYVIAKNMAFKQMARRKLHDKYCDYKVCCGSNHDAGTDEVVINREMALLIDIYIDNMPTQRKRVFELHQTGRKSDREIADVLKISINTVRTHLKLAKKGLKELAALSLFFL